MTLTILRIDTSNYGYVILVADESTAREKYASLMEPGKVATEMPIKRLMYSLVEGDLGAVGDRVRRPQLDADGMPHMR